MSDKADGRLERSKKSRDHIIQAVRELIDEGILIPTAQQVAETAGVGIRTVFRHFNDMENLFKEITKVNQSENSHFFSPLDKIGTLQERIANKIKTRSKAYTKMQNFILANNALRWRYKFLENQYKLVNKTMRDDFLECLPEVKKLSKEQQELVIALASFECWHRLKCHQNMSTNDINKLIINPLHDVLIKD